MADLWVHLLLDKVKLLEESGFSNYTFEMHEGLPSAVDRKVNLFYIM